MSYPPVDPSGTPPGGAPSSAPPAGPFAPESAPSQAQPRMVQVRRSTVRPTVTFIILGVTVFFYLLQMATQAGFLREPFLALAQAIFGPTLLNQLLQQGWESDLLTLLGAKINVLIAAGQYWRLLTPALLHASLVHIGFNMYALYAIGPSVEGFYGHWRFLALYVLGALGGNVLSFLMTPNLSVGASTAIFAIIAAEGIFIFQNRAIFGPQARGMLTNVIFVVVVNLGLGLSSSGIDNFGHLGGLLTGLAFGWFAGPKLKVEYQAPDYVLVDERSPAMAWVIGVVIAIFLIGLAFWKIATYPA